MNNRLYMIILLIFGVLLLTGCKDNNSIIVSENTGVTNSVPTTVESKPPLTNTVTVSPTSLPIPTTSLEQLQQNEFNSLCEQYSQMLIRADELGRIEDFIYCVDSMTNNKRMQIEHDKWKKQVTIQTTLSLSEEEMKDIEKGKFAKIPSEGVYLDFNLDGVEDTLIFCYDPDTTKHQEYIISINGKEEYGSAQELEGEIYVCAIESDYGKQVYLVVVENGPHGDDRGTYFWAYWDNKPCFLGYIPAPPEGITIEVYKGRNVVSYNRYEYESDSDSWIPYTAHSYISYQTDEDNNVAPILRELAN